MIEELIDRLENYYGFECEGGSLKNCLDWQQLVRLVREEIGNMTAPTRHPITANSVPHLRRQGRGRDEHGIASNRRGDGR